MKKDVRDWCMVIRRDEVWWADLPKERGSEQGGIRPVIILQNDTGNHFAPTTTVIPGTSAHKKRLPTHVPLKANSRIGLTLDSTFMAEQITTIDKSRIKQKLGELTDAELAQVSVALQVQLTLVLKDARQVS